MKRSFKTALGIVALVGWSLAASASPLVPQTSKGISYLAGGIGDDELEQIKAAQGSYNVKLLFSETSGAYVTDVDVSVSGKGGATVATIEKTGPYVLLRLPAGSFTIGATYDGKTVSRQLAVHGSSPQTLTFAWKGTTPP